MIAICYTGDIRHNQNLISNHHKKLFDKIQTLDNVKIYWFTKDRPERGICPYDDGSGDIKLRRGQGGAVQLWDFINSINQVEENIVIRMRTDTWFTDSSIDVIFNELKNVIAGNTDVAFFGSDLINGNVGKEYEKTFININDVVRIQDFIIVADKTKLRNKEDIYANIEATAPKKRRSGNKLFRYAIRQGSNAYTILCKIYLIRKYYNTEPTDLEVFKDYLDSYQQAGVEELLKPAYDWYEAQLK